MFLYVGSYLLIWEFESWITGVCSLYVISLCDFAYHVFGQEPAVAMHLALWYVVLVCHQHDVCENYVGGVYVGGLVMMFVVVWCLALWLGCLCLVLCGPSC